MNFLTSALKCLPCVALAFSAAAVDFARGEIVAFDMVDKAIDYTGSGPVTVINGEQIVGGIDNTAAGNINNISFVAFDINDDFVPDSEDPTIYYDFQIRTGSPPTGNQIVFDGFHQVFTPTLNGSYVVSADRGVGEWKGYTQPFVLGEVIGDMVDEFVHVRTPPVPPGAPGTFSIGVDEGGITTLLDPLADNFIGFKLQSGYYGWVRVQYDDITPGGKLTILDGAYESTGAPIAAGDSGSAPVDNADFNGDGKVDGRDFLVWQRGYGTPNATRAVGDANGDDSVNGIDLGIWQDQYGSGSLASVQVPEPGVLPLLACLVLAASRCSPRSNRKPLARGW